MKNWWEIDFLSFDPFLTISDHDAPWVDVQQIIPLYRLCIRTSASLQKWVISIHNVLNIKLNVFFKMQYAFSNQRLYVLYIDALYELIQPMQPVSVGGTKYIVFRGSKVQQSYFGAQRVPT